jgi:hypothetical protein
MELDELVTKIINHIDESTAKTESKIIQTKSEIILEVNVLLEQQLSQFNTFGEGLDTLRDQMNRRFDEIGERFNEVNPRFNKNDSEHQQIKQIFQELAIDQAETKKKVNDFENKLRRVK